MSAKHLARLRAQQEALPPVASASEDDSGSDSEDEPSQLKFNPFDLIQDEEGSGNEAEADAAADSPAASPRSAKAASPPADAPPQQQKPAAGRKATAKQAKHKGGGGGDEADIDQLLKDLDMAPAKVGAGAA